MKTKSLFYTVLATLVFTLFSCGGNSTSSEKESNKEQSKAAKEMTADEIGAAVSEIYVQAMTDLTGLLQDNPPAAEVEPKIASLKEEYIQKLIKYGEKREALEESDRSKMDLAIRLGLNDVYKDQVYANYSEAVNTYFNEETVRELLASFNILTQYANFELLKQQEPDEAQRLGIE